MAKRSGWMWISTALLCALLASFYLSLYYYTESAKYQDLYRDALKELAEHTIFVNILIDYGNGTKAWYNNTRVPTGANLFNATKMIAKIEYQRYDWGILITAINGVTGDQSHGWLWNIWDSTKAQWEFGPVGADAFTLKERDTVSWVYSAW